MSDKKVSRRNALKYIGAGAVVVAGAAAAAYYGLQPSTTPTQSATSQTASSEISAMTSQIATSTGEAKPDKLVIQCHEVHRKAAVGANRPDGVDLIAAWEKQTGIPIEFNTMANDVAFDKLMRETSSASSSMNVAACLNQWFSPRVTTLFEDLGPWNAQSPEEDMSDFIPSTLKIPTINGTLYGIPMRASAEILYYNDLIFKDRGITNPPTTMEEFHDTALRCSYTNSQGQQIYGYVADMAGGDLVDTMVIFMRAFGGDLISQDYKIKCTMDESIAGLDFLKKLYTDGVTPPDFLNVSNDGQVTTMKEGRAALADFGVTYGVTLNDPATSKVAGHLQQALLPPAAKFATTWGGTFPVYTFQWSWIIPKNGTSKSWAWEFIKYLTSKNSLLVESMQGNDVPRMSVMANPTYQQYWATKGLPKYPFMLSTAMTYAVPDFPGMDTIGQVTTAINNEGTAAILGQKTTTQAMTDLAAELAPLVPTT